MIAADGSLAPPGDCMVSPFPRLYKVLEADPSQAEQTCYKAARVSPGRPHHPMHFAQGRTDGWSVLSLGCGSPGKGDAGWSSPVARQAHNLKVVGSNPTPATNSFNALAGNYSLASSYAGPLPVLFWQV